MHSWHGDLRAGDNFTFATLHTDFERETENSNILFQERYYQTISIVPHVMLQMQLEVMVRFPAAARDFLFSTVSRPVLEPTQPPI
jgi:hypothetical protein